MIFEHVRLNDIPGVASHIIQKALHTPILCFYGTLGAGKTTLIREICSQLMVEDSVSSPTYPIINEYHYPGGILYHIDLYRLKSVEEALDIGLEEYLDSGNLCLIEWPDNFESILPEEKIKIFIRKLEEDTRTIEIATSR